MSTQPCNEPVCTESRPGVKTVIEPRARDLGNFEVRRVLPSSAQRMVGPFVFFDEMGPAQFSSGVGMDVRPRIAFRARIHFPVPDRVVEGQ